MILVHLKKGLRFLENAKIKAKIQIKDNHIISMDF
jgi:hypothetical protein